MSMAKCKNCFKVFNTDDDPLSTYFRENEFWCEACREVNEPVPPVQPYARPD